MTRDHDQAGQPFEPRTVRMKSSLYGGSRVAVPLVFMRRDDGNWYAKWLHLYQRGHPTWTPATNQADGNRVTTAMLARSVVERDYLRAGYLLDRWKHKGCPVLDAIPGDGEPVTWIGLEEPGQKTPRRIENLPPGPDRRPDTGLNATMTSEAMDGLPSNLHLARPLSSPLTQPEPAAPAIHPQAADQRRSLDPSDCQVSPQVVEVRLSPSAVSSLPWPKRLIPDDGATGDQGSHSRPAREQWR